MTTLDQWATTASDTDTEQEGETDPDPGPDSDAEADGGDAETDADSETFTITRYCCPDCDDRFDTRPAAADHCWDIHVDHDAYPVLIACTECGATVESHAELTTHHERNHVPEVAAVGCTQCREQFDDEDEAVSHFWAQHVYDTPVLSERVPCPACDWWGSSERALLLDHCYERHDVAVLFGDEDEDGAGAGAECPVCGDGLADERGMLQHVADVHSLGVGRVYHCTVCETAFEDRETAGDHVRATHAPQVEGVTETTTVCPACTTPLDGDELASHYTRAHCGGQVVCPACEETAGVHESQRIKRHYWEVHASDVAVEAEAVAHVDRAETLECLYNINKHAKKYADLGTKNYRQGKKTTAKANSLKKDALYAIKERVLEQIYEDAEAIRIHRIDGSEFYLTDFGMYSFHSPIETLSLPDRMVEGRESLDDFESDAEKEHSDKSLKAALQFFEREFGLNANAFLGQQYLSYGYNSYFIGWSYLGEDTNGQA